MNTPLEEAQTKARRALRGENTAAESEGGAMEFGIGDVVRGKFSSRPGVTETVIVRGKVGDEWQGDCLQYTSGFGYGAWGYSSEVAEVLRQANAEDERIARGVKARVSAETDRMLRHV